MAQRQSDRANLSLLIEDMTMSQGNIVQCIGAVVDIQFPRDAMPRIYDALLLDKTEEHGGCEVDPVSYTHLDVYKRQL